jgi:hypothetical protein
MCLNCLTHAAVPIPYTLYSMPHFCKFVPISRKSIHTTYEVYNIARNGAKIRKENPRVFTERKSAEKYFMKSTCHPSPEVFFRHQQCTSVYRIQYSICTLPVTVRFIKQSLGAFCDLLPVIYCLDLSAFLFSTLILQPAVYKLKCYLGIKSYKVPRFII